MKRRAFLALAAGFAAPWPDRAGIAAAQGNAQQPRIGILLPGSRKQAATAEHPVIAGLRDVGLIDGKTATLLFKEGEGHSDRLPRLASELVSERPDVIITAGPQSIRTLKRETATIPIVMAIVGDPVADGFVESFRHPGGNLTGASMVNPELSSKRIELLREIAPNISRVTVFSYPTGGLHGLPETATAAHSLGLELQVLSLTGDQIEHGFSEAERAGAQALLVLSTPFYNTPEVRQKLGDLALRYRLPSICEEASFVRQGCLLSYGPDFSEMWRHAAVFVDKILRGAEPGDLPIEQPTKFQLLVNMKTAAGLGLTIPQMILLRADEVVE